MKYHNSALCYTQALSLGGQKEHAIFKKFSYNLVSFLHDFWLFLFGNRQYVVPPEEAIESRLLLRWGDGESALLFGKSIRFQAASLSLSLELIRILSQRAQGYLLCFPFTVVSKTRFLREAMSTKRAWSLTALVFRVFRGTQPTSDALMFRNDAIRDGREALRSLLQQSTRILIVAGDCEADEVLRSWLGPFSSVQSIELVRAPTLNAYESIDTILRDILSRDIPDVALFSAGPGGKCVAARLVDYWPRDTRLIDVGHLFLHLYTDGTN